MTSKEINYQIIVPESEIGKTIQQTYERNITEFTKYFPEAAKELEHVNFDETPLFCDDAYRYGIRTTDAAVEQFEMFTDFDSIQLRQKKLIKVCREYRYIIFLGTGIGEYFLALADLLKKTDASTVCNSTEFIVVEPDPIWLKGTMSFIDLHDFWGQPGLHLHVGEKYMVSLQEFFLLLVDSTEKILIIVNPTRNFTQLQNELLELIEKNSKHQVDLWSTQQQSVGMMPITFTEEHQENYFKNMRSLECSPHFYRDMSTMKLLKSGAPELVNDAQGAVRLVVNEGDGLILSTKDEELSSILQQYKQNNSHKSTYLVAGSGDGKALFEILALSDVVNRWEGFAQIIYLIELHPLIFKVCLYLYDFSAALESKRLRIFLGNNCLSLFAHYIKNDLQARRPNTFFVSAYYQRADLITQLQMLLKAQVKEEEFEEQQIYNEIAAYYNSIGSSYWEKCFSTKGKPRILCISSLLSSFVQHCSRDLMDGFTKIGCEGEIVIEQDGMSSLSRLDILRALQRVKPDLVFLLDHLRDESKYIPPNVPYFCWVQDPLYNLFSNELLVINDFEIVYAVSSKWVSELQQKKKYQNTTVKLLHLGVNDSVYKQVTDVSKHYDVSYISHMYPVNDLLDIFDKLNKKYEYNPQEKKLITSDPELTSVMASLYPLLSDFVNTLDLKQLNTLISDAGRKKVLEDFFIDLGIGHKQDFLQYIAAFRSRFWKSIEAKIKYLVVSVLLDNGFNTAVWGVNWDQYPNMHSIAQGVAENGEMVNEIQNMSSISINNSPLLSFHMKALEIMASNNFMLSRKHPHDIEPITKYFQEGSEVVLFENEKELVAQTAYFLKNYTERQAIAQKAYEKVIEKYTYTGVSRKIKNDFYERFSSPPFR